MNRQTIRVLAVALSLVCIQTSRGQSQAHHLPGQQSTYTPQTTHVPHATYPAQPAVYMNANPALSGVYPATMGPAILPGTVQHAACQGCQGYASGSTPVTAYTGAEVVQGGAYVAGCDAGCDTGCDSPGGCDSDGRRFNCGKLFGGCGLFAGGCPGACGGGNGQGCGGGQCGHCFGGSAGLCGLHGSGGCCLPRWYDVQAEWLYWKRDDIGSSSSNELDGIPLGYSEESGYRVTGAYMFGVATSLEVGYFGGFNWATGYSLTDGGQVNGFDSLGIGLSSEINNGEINVRHRWVSSNCKLHSSVLVGARYFRLQEELVANTFSESGALNYHLKTDNDLVGSQLGTDLFLCITPRLKIGGEVEGGVYGTSTSRRANVNGIGDGSFSDYAKDNDVAFLGEAGVMALFRATSHLTLRVGYQVLYVDGVATVLDNVNVVSPFNGGNELVNNDGDAFFHGASLGFEWTH